MFFQQNREIYYSQIDKNRCVSPVALLQFFQDIAVEHTNQCGYSIDRLTALRRAWLLLSMHVRFDKPIKSAKNVVVKTWTYEFSKVFGPRAYQVFDGKTEELYATASAMWTYVDIDSGRPTEIPEEFVTYFGNGEAPDISYLRRSPAFEADECIFKFPVLKHDLDSNNHMNNVKYLEYALENLPEGAVCKEAEIFYKLPLFEGETVSVFRENGAAGSINLTFKNDKEQNCAFIKLVLG